MRRYRLLAISVLGVAGVLLGVLFVGNINGNLVYFLTPQEALEQKADFDDGRRFQIGGLVQDGSVETTDGGLRFVVTSGPATVPVAYRGAPAQLFRAGIGVVLEGAWDGDTFRADTMIIKHDENYRPPDDGEADERTT
jgi:cytochrome c-type biogenesis protein CcmE